MPSPDTRPAPPSTGASRVFSRPSWPEARYVAAALRTETIGGALLLLAAVAALVEGAERLAQEIYAGVVGRTLR